MTNNSKEHLYKEAEKLADKAEKSRQAHFVLSGKLSFRSKLLHSVILIGSSLVAIFTFANYKAFLPILPSLDQDVFTLFVGFLAIIVFILSVFEEFIRWRDMGLMHEDAGKKMTSLIRDAYAIRKNPDITEIDLKHLRTWYQSINETSPSIPDKVFLKAKQDYLKKLIISQKLDDNPFKSIKSIVKEMKM